MTITITVPSDLAELLARRAQAQQCSVEALVISYIAIGLGNQQHIQPELYDQQHIQAELLSRMRDEPESFPLIAEAEDVSSNSTNTTSGDGGIVEIMGIFDEPEPISLIAEAEDTSSNLTNTQPGNGRLAQAMHALMAKDDLDDDLDTGMTRLGGPKVEPPPIDRANDIVADESINKISNKNIELPNDALVSEHRPPITLLPVAITLDPDVQAYFPDSYAVNQVLRGLVNLIPKQEPS